MLVRIGAVSLMIRLSYLCPGGFIVVSNLQATGKSELRNCDLLTLRIVSVLFKVYEDELVGVLSHPKGCGDRKARRPNAFEPRLFYDLGRHPIVSFHEEPCLVAL